MRIVGGEFRGRRLAAPKSDRIRPTTDRNRESLFNILSNRIDLDGSRVIDLFAGTGALGFEALSRGAGHALFVDDGAEARALLQQNIESLGLQGRARLFRRDATRLGAIGTLRPFDLAFLDPPYGRGLGERALGALRAGGWLDRDALVVLEERHDSAPLAIEGFEILDRRDFGETAMVLAKLG
ncbi:MAG: 16S rRNA (guanine(966)-N(2))-methyltransferase RsmD [Nitratireductor sp.]|nr:16S rRNA (guanine(966)-N(2))-methyltransferase RsmD [Nitratireductor sp.]